jgi:hypothetical protein
MAMERSEKGWESGKMASDLLEDLLTPMCCSFF